MKRILLPLLVPLGWCSVALAQVDLEFRLLRTDPKTAGFLCGAIDGNQLPATELGAKLDELIEQGRIEQAARFQRKFDGEMEEFEFAADAAEIEVADGEFLRGGIFLETNPVASAGGRIDVLYALRTAEKLRRNRIAAFRALAACTLEPDQWRVLTSRGDAEFTELLVARGTCAVPIPQGLHRKIRQIDIRHELRECSAADLKQLDESAPDAREALVETLRQRCPLVRSGRSVLRPGEKAASEDLVEWIDDLGQGWETHYLGSRIEFIGNNGADGESIDLQVSLEWSPLDAKRPPEEPEAVFRLSGTLRSGETLVVRPEPRRDDIPVWFVSPEFESAVSEPDRGRD